MKNFYAFFRGKNYNTFMQIIEAIPNFSEGKNLPLVSQIAKEAVAGSRARILHLDSNPDANRTVLTLAGEPEEVVKACLALFASCQKHLDMRTQHGAHPRLGSVDVCPLVPITNITLEETALWADMLARQVGSKLNIPVYLYEKNASSPLRKNLAFIRQGEYESLPAKLPALPPDYGPAVYSPEISRTGASVIGARNFLIAFNISLNTQEVSLAKEIAAVLREKNGGLPAVKAIGWLMPEYHAAQVSFNLTDFRTTGLAQVWQACSLEARKRGVTATAGELIGLAPREAFLQAGKFYAPQETDSSRLIRLAVEKLSLNKIRPFVAEERILENKLSKLL